MSYFPFFMNIEGKRGLVVGGGTSALFKVKKLLPFQVNLEVIALNVLEEIQVLALEGKLHINFHSFSEKDLVPVPQFVIVALEEKEESRNIAILCRERGILVNVVDDPSYCDFYFPSLITRGKCSIGISTSGASPAIASLLREQIEQIIPENMEEILDWLEEKRPQLKLLFSKEQVRKQVLKTLYLTCVEKNKLLPQKEYEEFIALLLVENR